MNSRNKPLSIKHPPYYPSDTRRAIERDHNHLWRVAATDSEPVNLAVDAGAAKQKFVALELENAGLHSNLSFEKRIRRVVLTFTAEGHAEDFVAAVKKPPHSITTKFNGPNLLKRLAQSAHEPESHAAHFAQAVLLAIDLRDTTVQGMPLDAGQCTAQLLARDCVFNSDRGRLECRKTTNKGHWTAYFNESQHHCATRRIGGGKPVIHAQAVSLTPQMSVKYAAGQLPLYKHVAHLNTRLLQHLDCGAFGLDNFIVHKATGGVLVRAPSIHPKSGVWVCPDSLSFFMIPACLAAHDPSQFAAKLNAPQICEARMDEIRRYLRSTLQPVNKKPEPFVPRSHLTKFDAVEVKKGPESLDPNNQVAAYIPVSLADLKGAIELYRREVVASSRGVVDFSQGLQVHFTPVHKDRFITALSLLQDPKTFISQSITVEIVYIPLLGWLDTEEASCVPSNVLHEEEEDSANEDAERESSDEKTKSVGDEDDEEEEQDDDEDEEIKTEADGVTSSHGDFEEETAVRGTVGVQKRE